MVLDDVYLTRTLSLEGFLDQRMGYSSCDYKLLPLWEINVELADGSSIHLLERFEEVVDIAATGPASLVSASINIGDAKRETTDYWNLIYSSLRHNFGARYWIIMDPAIDLPGLGRPVHVVEGEGGR